LRPQPGAATIKVLRLLGAAVHGRPARREQTVFETALRTYPLESLFGRVLSPFERFLQRATAGGVVLMVTTFVSLVLATAVGDHALHAFWERRIAITVAPSYSFELSLHAFVNDGLMAFFFLLVGLELKREMLVGELSSIKDAALPVIAAAGGMIVPALIFAAFNAGHPTADGWGIPMATDIAFAVGILVLLAWRIPRNLTIFLVALAIADDLGAVLVIALFYTAELDLHALATAAVIFGVLWLFNRGGMRNTLPYVLAGVLLWFALQQSGVHATLAGILLAATIPARPSYTPGQFERRIGELHRAFRADRADQHTPDDPLSNSRMASLSGAIERSAVAVQSPLQRMEHRLTPWVTFLILPIFALANAGIDLAGIDWASALSSRLTLGVALGLVFGKFIGVTSFSWMAVRLGVGRLPQGVEWKHLMGAAWLAGIGFTMSLFVAQLAFRDPLFIDEAKLGILLGSALAAAVGLTWLFRAGGTRVPGNVRKD
jgi:Na+:H+ antiporter, NhaA family